MRVTKEILLIFCGIFLATGVVFAQEATRPAPTPQPAMQEGPGPGSLAERVEILGFGGWHGGKIVTGAPFSALAVTETDQILADGNKISHKIETKLYRDSQGRVRREVSLQAFGPFAAQGQLHTFVVIQDPVAGTAYVLNPDLKTARELPDRFGKGNGRRSEFASRGARQESNADFQKVTLGAQSISGVTAEGTRYTRTIPAGEIGNEKPITTVRETWYSPDLQMMVKIQRTDPRFGNTTYTLTNIQRSEPDADLFKVPADYTVKQGGRGRALRFMRKEHMPPSPVPDAPGPDL